MSIITPGTAIGRFTVQSLIKANLYTETYRAEDDEHTPFFLKLFIPKRMPERLINADTGTVREIEYARRISHRNIVSYVDSGTIESQEGNCQYYLTNYFSGELLAERIQRQGKLRPEEATDIFREILNGLAYLHNLSPTLCHNDITPRNIMLAATTGGTPEIIDLGHVAPPCNGRIDFDTTDLDIYYSANETFPGTYDQQSDIFAATAVLYTMLTGQAPWHTDLPAEAKRSRKAMLLKEYRKANPIDLSRLDIEERLRIIIAKGMTPTYNDRYKDIPQLLSDLDGQDTPQHTHTVHTHDSETPHSETTAESPNKVDFDIKRGSGNGFKDIAGMRDLKQYLTQRVIFVIKNHERAERYRLTPPNGMLLYGPPGCGKTFVAEKFAEETGFNFALIKSSDLASSFVHGGQEKIAQLFRQAEKKAPVVLCFDEFDALVPDRSNPGSQYVTSEVNEFLTQLNNCSKRGIFVVATSNRPDKIDPAILRTGRIDKQVYVPLPDREARREMFAIHLQGRPCDDIDHERLAELSEGYIASDIAYVVNDAAMTAAFTDQPITQQIIETAINNTRPSLRKDTLRTFDDIRSRMEGRERSNALPHIGFT